MSRVSTAEARASIERSVEHIEKQIGSLTDLRVLGYIEEADFIKRHEKLQSTLLAARSRHEKVNTMPDWFEPLMSVISFSKCAVPWFIRGDNETKRTIIKTVGSNPTLLDNRVSICMAKPFVLLSESDGIPGWSSEQESNLH